MATVELTNFRCHPQLKINLSRASLIKISGNSGKGKSTLFTAILWCLYKKITKVSPLDNPKAQTTVKLTLLKEGLVITRQNKSHSLCVERPGIPIIQYHGEDAQNYINSYFGNCDFWLSTSYLQQNKFNALLDGSAANKLELIDRLALNDSIPSEDITRVEQSYNLKLRELESLRETFKKSLEELQILMGQYNIQGDELQASNIIGAEKRAEMEELILKHTQVVQNERDVYSHIRKRLETLRVSMGSSTLLDVENQLKDLDSQTTAYQQAVKEVEINRLHEKLSKEREDLLISLSKYGDIPSFPQPRRYTDMEMSIVQQTETIYAHKLEEAANLGLTYSLDVICKELESIDRQLRDEATNQKNREAGIRIVMNLERDQQSLKDLILNKPPFAHIGTIETLVSQINALMNSREEIRNRHQDRIASLKNNISTPALSCPHCQGVVRFKDNSLIEVPDYHPEKDHEELVALLKEQQKDVFELEGKIKNLMDELEVEKTRLRKYQEYTAETQRLNANCDRLVKELEALPNEGTRLNPQQIGELYSRQAKMTSLLPLIIPPFVSSERMKQETAYVDKLQLEKQIADLATQIEALPLTRFKGLEVPPCDLAIIQKKYYELSKVKSDIEEIDRITLKHPLIPEPSVALKAQEEITRLKGDIYKSDVIAYLVSKRDPLIPLRDSISRLESKVAAIARLKSTMIHAEYLSYQQVAEKINSHLAIIAPMLFEGGMSIKLELFKTLKTQDRVKPVVNVKIIHGGYEKDPKDLSGGEYERVSLAFTLALMNLSTSSLVILDETFASLGEEDQARALSVIEMYSREVDPQTKQRNNRTFLCVSHGSITGWYDDHIEVDRGVVRYL